MEITCVKNFKEKIFEKKESKKVVVFYSNDHPHTIQLINLLPHFQKDFDGKIEFLKVNLHNHEVFENYFETIRLLPTILFYDEQNLIGKMEGFKAADILEVLNSWIKTNALPKDKKDLLLKQNKHKTCDYSIPLERQIFAIREKEMTLESSLELLINAHYIQIFIKGSKEEPFCRFTKQLLAILSKYEIEFREFNIFDNETVREELKKFSSWPTFPQIYVMGELVGGVDIIRQMDEEGSLSELLNKKTFEEFEARIKNLPIAIISKRENEIINKKTIELEKLLQDSSITNYEVLNASDFPTLFSNGSSSSLPRIYTCGKFAGTLRIAKETLSVGGTEELKKMLSA